MKDHDIVPGLEYLGANASGGTAVVRVLAPNLFGGWDCRIFRPGLPPREGRRQASSFVGPNPDPQQVVTLYADLVRLLRSGAAPSVREAARRVASLARLLGVESPADLPARVGGAGRAAILAELARCRTTRLAALSAVEPLFKPAVEDVVFEAPHGTTIPADVLERYRRDPGGAA